MIGYCKNLSYCMNPVLLFQIISESQQNNLRAVIFIIIYD